MLKRHVYKVAILWILTCYCYMPTGLAQNLSQDQIIASYLYNFIKHITWPANANPKLVEIGIYSPVDKALRDKLAEHFQGTKIDGRAVRIVEFLQPMQAGNYDVIFVEEQNNNHVYDIHHAIGDKPVLLVTNNMLDKQLVMINLFNTVDNRIRFEVNKANLLVHGLSANPDIILNGGSEIDVAKLFREGQASLVQMQEKLREREQEFHTLSAENSTLNENLKRLNTAIARNRQQMQNQERLIKDQTQQLEITSRERARLLAEIDLKTQDLANRQALLDKISGDIRNKETQLKTLNDTILRQKSRILELDDTISTQDMVLTNLSFLSLAAIVLIAVVIWAYNNKRRDAARLEARGKELNLAKDRLAVAKVKAEEANQAKSEFLSLMSHELRTPLQAIIGYTDVVIEDLRLEGMDQYTVDLDRVVNNSERLLRLINGVLDLAKIESGRMDLHLEPVNLETTTHDAVANVRPQFDEKSLPLAVQVDNGPCLPVADQEKLLHIILNLLGNACKFTERGLVKIIVEHRKDHIYISCQDTGAGIKANQLPHVFDRFQQADSSATRTHSGSGLGLAITKQFCELMGGKIEVHSELNLGTTFVIQIPLPVQPSTTAVTRSEPRGVNPDVRAPAAPSNQSREPILMIDDDEEFLGIMSRTLQKSGYRVHTATTAEEGLNTAKRTRPKLIIMDLLLPDKHGWELFKNIKEIPDLEHIPIIVASIIDDRKKSESLGADGFLTKPIARSALQVAVEKLTTEIV